MYHLPRVFQIRQLLIIIACFLCACQHHASLKASKPQIRTGILKVVSSTQSFRANYHLSFIDSNHYHLTLSATLAPTVQLIMNEGQLRIMEGKLQYSQEQINDVAQEVFAGLSPDKMINYVINKSFNEPDWKVIEQEHATIFEHRYHCLRLTLKPL